MLCELISKKMSHVSQRRTLAAFTNYHNRFCKFISKFMLSRKTEMQSNNKWQSEIEPSIVFATTAKLYRGQAEFPNNTERYVIRACLVWSHTFHNVFQTHLSWS